MRRILLTALVFAALLGAGALRSSRPPQAPGGMEENDRWLAELREAGLALTPQEAAEVERHPWALPERKRKVADRYDEILARIRLRRAELARRWGALPPEAELARARVEQEALVFLELAARAVLFPLWSGGQWALDGTASRPQQGEVACGWYVQRIMEHLGFRVGREPALQMAYLASDEQVWSWSGRWSERIRGGGQGLRRELLERGPGLYILGLSSDWGHVLFAINRGGEWITLHHSGPSFDHAWVTYDDLDAYMDFMRPRLIHAAKLDRSLARRWLSGRELVPIQTHRHRRGESAPERVVRLQRGLHRAGYPAGGVDGVFGTATRRALLRFQAARGLERTGLPDDPTLAALTR